MNFICLFLPRRRRVRCRCAMLCACVCARVRARVEMETEIDVWKKLPKVFCMQRTFLAKMVVWRVCVLVCFSVIDAVLIVETECALIEYVIQASDAIC